MRGPNPVWREAQPQMTLFSTTAHRPIDTAILDALAGGLPIDHVSRRRNGEASSLYLRDADRRLLRVSDHVLPPWIDAPVHHADIMLSRKRSPSRVTVRRAMTLLCAGRRTARLARLAQAAPVTTAGRQAPGDRQPSGR